MCRSMSCGRRAVRDAPHAPMGSKSQGPTRAQQATSCVAPVVKKGVRSECRVCPWLSGGKTPGFCSSCDVNMLQLWRALRLKKQHNVGMLE